jgi:hypothetical protein
MVLYGELCPLSSLSDADSCKFDRPAENGEIELKRYVLMSATIRDAGGCYCYESSK